MFSQFEISNRTCANTLRTGCTRLLCPDLKRTEHDDHFATACHSQPVSLELTTRKATNPKLDSREELSTNLPSTTFQCQTE